MRFTKMQGLGNDYIYLNCMERYIEDVSALAVTLSDRHFGVGGDGLICIGPSDHADFRMEIYNADGSRAEMCGNGIRCLGKYVYDAGLTTQTELAIETPAGVRQISLCRKQGRITEVTVDMGIPVIHSKRMTEVHGAEYTLLPVSMGNPHAVLFVSDPYQTPVERLGPAVECHPSFPGRTNVEFAAVTAPDAITMRVWERGSGETLACGTGACAVLAAAVQEGLCGREAAVHLPGGKLNLRWSEQDGRIYMTGPAVTVFEGDWPMP